MRLSSLQADHPVFTGLEFGLQKPILVREEALSLGLGLQVLYASDLHLRSSNKDTILNELWSVCENRQPDLLLLGGDLADHPACLPELTSLVKEVCKFATVGAVSGNHDTLLGKNRTRLAVLEGGGHWLHDGPVRLAGLHILGDVEQKSEQGVNLLCHHYPTIFPVAYKAGIRVVFAGHLHGWQVVFGQIGEYLYPGAWLSRWNGLRFEREGSTLFVSRGMTDLLPLRWNCPREVILVTL